MDNIEFATNRRICAVWTVAFRRVEGGVEILAYDNGITLGYEEEHAHPHGIFTETQDRTVRELVLSKGDNWHQRDSKLVSQERLTIVNPGHIFSYGKGEF